ncbi:MAG: phosphoribosylformylglycinamidine synthase, partial [Xanthomonadales bacterium]|nr:phosphoribosylformylglycinamidine synthase [Xanthomonadales bacterium]
MSEYICMRGAAALSAFRLQKLQRRVLDACGVDERPTAHFVYLAELGRPLPPEKLDWLQRLVHGRQTTALGRDGLALVIPRIGTQSPWSSKATDIAQRCHLEAVERIERGVAFTLPRIFESLGEVPPAVIDLLHDRMTQAVVPALDDAWALFAHREPAALARIPVLERGLEALEHCNRELGLALSDDEMAYLVRAFTEMGRDPSDAELMMFAQANSEHC